MKNFAIIGLGFISSRHRQAIQEIGGKIILTCDIDPSKGADFTDWIEMIHSPKFNDIDFVSICTPNYTHSAIVREILRTGKKVICEKPLTIFNDTDGLSGANVVLQLRYNPKVIKLKRSLKGKENHIDITVKTFREDLYFKSWKGDSNRSGGILYNMGVHYIDLLEHLLGSVVEIETSHYEQRIAWGRIKFEKGIGTYRVELSSEQGVERKIMVNGHQEDLEGATIPLKETGGKVVNLHTQVYKALIRGKGIKAKEAQKSLRLVDKLQNGISAV